MFRINSVGATVDNRFKESPLPATRVSGAWLNAVQEEVVSVIADAGIALDAGENDQLLQAIDSKIAVAVGGIDGAAGFDGSLADPGWCQLPNGLILQWGTHYAAVSGEGTQSIAFPVAFPTACLMRTATAFISSASNDRDVWVQLCGVASPTGLTVMFQSDGVSNNFASGFEWFAIGV